MGKYPTPIENFLRLGNYPAIKEGNPITTNKMVVRKDRFNGIRPKGETLTLPKYGNLLQKTVVRMKMNEDKCNANEIPRLDKGKVNPRLTGM